jgi:hypothetical protein
MPGFYTHTARTVTFYESLLNPLSVGVAIFHPFKH